MMNMNIKTKQFQILTDINLVWNFMTDIYDPYFANGVAAPFFEYALTSKWMDKEYLHLNRLVFFNWMKEMRQKQNKRDVKKVKIDIAMRTGFRYN